MIGVESYEFTNQVEFYGLSFILWNDRQMQFI